MILVYSNELPTALHLPPLSILLADESNEYTIDMPVFGQYAYI